MVHVMEEYGSEIEYLLRLTKVNARPKIQFKLNELLKTPGMRYLPYGRNGTIAHLTIYTSCKPGVMFEWHNTATKISHHFKTTSEMANNFLALPIF